MNTNDMTAAQFIQKFNDRIAELRSNGQFDIIRKMYDAMITAAETLGDTPAIREEIATLQFLREFNANNQFRGDVTEFVFEMTYHQ